MPTSATIPIPPLPPGSARRPPPGRYRAQFGVIVLVADEVAQKRTFEALVKQGFSCRVVST